jgi:hypothetical protein
MAFRIRAVFVSGTISVIALASVGSTARAATTQARIDPQAVSALERMSAFLRSQRAMTVTAETTTDEVLDNGQKVQRSGVAVLKVSRPDRLRADVMSDRRNEQIFYDGKTFTLYQPALGYYGSFNAPPTLAQLVYEAEQRYGVDMPLADLFAWGTAQSPAANLKGAISVGPSAVKGVKCDHYAFHEADVDWEVCIEQGARPLPLKLVITTTTERTQPQHVAVMSWDLAPRLDESLFTFNPPATAHRIDFDVASESSGLPRQGRAGGHPQNPSR